MSLLEHIVTHKIKTKDDLLAIGSLVAGARNKQELTGIIASHLKALLPFDDFKITVVDKENATQTPFIYSFKKRRQEYPDFMRLATTPHTITPVLADAIANGDILTVTVDDMLQRRQPPFYAKPYYDTGIKEMIVYPMRNAKDTISLLIFTNEEENRFTPKHHELVKNLSSILGVTVANILANEKIETQLEKISAYKKQLEREKKYLQDEIKITYNYNEIIGSSEVMKEVFSLVSKVAPSQSSVLLLGETGTGKELIARAIHIASPRRDKMMVKVNCATLPANLIESELFGHERGSFTGATDRRIGKFELANGGTLFLDEIGEMPLELQVKLLRALQEKEIERIGGRTVIKTDVRIIAATNKDLQKSVQEGTFRSDLFFRLHVFPITLPPLRERRDDIPLLATHFLQKYASNANKDKVQFSSAAMKQLVSYDWPGNVRELEHLVERCLLLASGNIIHDVPLPAGANTSQASANKGAVKSIDDVEREHILHVLRLTHGKVAGAGGAAEKLNIPSTTLNSKMKRLKIKKGYFEE